MALKAPLYFSSAHSSISLKSLWGKLGVGDIRSAFGLHILLGLSTLLSRYVFIIWFYALVLNFLTLSRRQQREVLPLFLGYLIPAELFGRMVGGSPYLPWEMGKYLGMLLLIYGIFLNRRRKNGKTGWWILLFSVPGLLLGILASERVYKDIVFNYLGLFNLTLAVIFFANYNMSQEKLRQIFRLILLGSLTVLSYSFFRTPDLSEVEFALGANFDVTGDFGSNQVASVLGLAFGLSAFLWLMQAPLFKSELLNLGLPGAFLIWALFSFSRGGVLTPALGLLLVIILVPRKKGAFQLRTINSKLIIGLLVLLPGIFYVANTVTNGQLLLRYSGETYGTLQGVKQKDLNQLTTGRWDIFLNDIKIWQDHFVFGVGVGQSAEIRPEYGEHEIIAHVEVSRLLSEHGLMGLIISIIYISTPIVLFFKAKTPFEKGIMLLSFTIAIASSMHSAMRTFITPFFYGLGFVILVTPQKYEYSATTDLHW